jgi:pyruvate ferredoxin oxidoreductase alpha subunit
MGPLALYDYYFEHKRQQEEAMKNANPVITKINDEYAEISGRKYGDGLIQPYMMDDAETAVICLGSTAGTTRVVVKDLRRKGVKAGLVKLRAFRPFPTKELIKVLSDVSAIGVLDRSGAYGAIGGPIFNEVRSILYDLDERPHVTDYIYGLGGRDMSTTLITDVFRDLANIVKTDTVKQRLRFIGVR